jgi:glyoxylate reductase
MKKILITRRLSKLCEEKASNMFDTKLNSNDELYSQTKLIELSKGCDGILTSITDKIEIT